jgi:hypothetical protein
VRACVKNYRFSKGVCVKNCIFKQGVCLKFKYPSSGKRCVCVKNCIFKQGVFKIQISCLGDVGGVLKKLQMFSLRVGGALKCVKFHAHLPNLCVFTPLLCILLWSLKRKVGGRRYDQFCMCFPVWVRICFNGVGLCIISSFYWIWGYVGDVIVVC